MMRSSVPLFSSTISSAIRRSVRCSARASRTVLGLEAMSDKYGPAVYQNEGYAVACPAVRTARRSYFGMVQVLSMRTGLTYVVRRRATRPARIGLGLAALVLACTSLAAQD